MMLLLVTSLCPALDALSASSYHAVSLFAVPSLSPVPRLRLTALPSVLLGRRGYSGAQQTCPTSPG